jgi:hypothetical protein
MALLGVHCSVAGGLENAFVGSKVKNIDTSRYFQGTSGSGKRKPISVEEQERFLAAEKTICSKNNFLPLFLPVESGLVRRKCTCKINNRP